MLVQKENDILHSILNKSIIDIDRDEEQTIRQRWLIIEQDDSFINSTQALYVLTVFFIIIFFFMHRQYILRNINKQLEDDKRKIKHYLKIVDKNVITSSTDLKGKITYVSEAFCQISGYAKDELLNNNHNIVRHPDMPSELYEDMWKTIKSGAPWSGEIKNRTKDGEYYWVQTTISQTFNEITNHIGYTAIRQDITDKKRIEELAITDGLTNLFNRRHFDTLFPKMIEMAKRNNEIICFLIMDIDHFKLYNDTYGHQRGDEVLRRVADAIKKNLKREGDYCFRLGGEEFGVLFKVNYIKDTLAFANSFRTAIEDLKIEHSKNSASQYITASMGLICNHANDIKSIDEIYKQADDLLYISKESGRNKVTVKENNFHE